MRRIWLFVGLVAAVAAGCSKDKGDAVAQKKPAPGVSVVPANELGPQSDEIVNEVSITTSSKQARAAFVRGRELFENIRHAEAADKFREAIELDDKFALAHTYLGLTDEGPSGLEELRRGFQLAQTLPPAERMVTKVFLLRREGDRDKHTAAVKKMAELAPGDWRVQTWLAHDLMDRGDGDGALAAFELSTRLNSKAAEPYNYIAYLHANAGRYDRAVEAAKRYATLKPTEPNPQDSLGEILMMAGKFEDAEAAFKRALDVSSTFSIAWEGVAISRVYREDYDGAVEALERARQGARDAKGRNKAVSQMAWVSLIRGDLDGALAIVDGQLEIEDGYGYMKKVARVDLYTAAGDYEAAMKELRPVIAEVSKHKKERADRLGWMLVKKVVIQVEGGHADKAVDTLAAIDEIRGDIHSPFFRHGEAYARGVVAFAQGKHDEAFAQLESITNPLYPYGVDAMWKKPDCLAAAGKTAKAEAARNRLRTTFRREFYHAYRLTRPN